MNGDGRMPDTRVPWVPHGEVTEVVLCQSAEDDSSRNDESICKFNEDVEHTIPKEFVVTRTRNPTIDEITSLLDEKIQSLLMCEDYLTVNTHEDLKFIQRQTRYSGDIVVARRIVEHIVCSGFAHVYLRVWQSISKVDYLSPEHESQFNILQMSLSIIWNCTDKSVHLCESLVRGAVLHLFLSELAAPSLRQADFESDAARLYLVKAYLGVLHNIVRLCTDSRKMFRSANAVSVLSAYLDRPQGLIRTKAYLILSYIISEEENGVINATNVNLAYIVEILRAALEEENHFATEYAFWAEEIVCGLNHLAVNDSNKVKLCSLGVLPLYLNLLRDGSAEEQSLAASGLWILSFHVDNKPLMRREPGCIEALQYAATNDMQESVRRAARGALWVVVGTREHSASNSSVDTVDVDIDEKNAPHVMISYHWGSQKTVLSVRERLKAEGFRVWMDVDNMSGSTLEAMAHAVEKAAVVLVCMSQGYKDSPSCRTEAEYTYRLRKDIIPLVLQPGYVPDGWLGMLVGTRLYFDLSDPVCLDTQLTRAVRELGSRGRMPAYSRSVSCQSSKTCFRVNSSSSSTCGGTSGRCRVSESSTGFCDASPVSLAPSLHSYGPPQKTAITWTQGDVAKWLASHQLAHLSERLKEFDGVLLMQYKRMQQTASSYFYQTLETMLGLSLVDILRFSASLETLT